ncbi:unnamed protein product [Dovyalis caffra]|uniref:Ubiquitin fusion degradaton protein n=1 Tax=Dovyalis caffra TaxID=77055 RepID=A0AAV1QZD5_9ROSI|nr:unnamed protein product [Dovyalis caffra]
MPPSALHLLAMLEISYPMLFELHNTLTGHVSHCGVLEFTAEEGFICLPQWMMENLKLAAEGSVVLVKSVYLVKGTYIKLQPHTARFLELSSPKSVLENTLRNFTCLNVGDTIMIMHNNTKYYIDVVEAKPSSGISIVETDCEVDFAPPLDYQERELERMVKRMRIADDKEQSIPQHPTKLKEEQEQPVMQEFTPIHSKHGKLVFDSNVVEPRDASRKLLKEDGKKETLTKEEERFKSFTGRSFKLSD